MAPASPAEVRQSEEMLPRRLLRFPLCVLTLVVLALVAAFGRPASAEVGVFHPDLVEATAAVEATRGPQVYAALRELWGTWDRADPVQVEESLLAAAEGGKLSPPARVYASLLSAYARRRRGDLDGAVERVSKLGFVGDWLFVGPFDNENKTGFAQAFQPEEEQKQAIVPGRAYDGKERPVRWRRLPGGGSGYGWFDFGDLLRPRADVCAYATTFLKAKEGSASPRTITLWVGASGAFKLFYNGQQVLEDKAYRDVDIDRFATAVTLGPGHNRVTMKVCGATQAPRFTLRIGDARGAPDLNVHAIADFAPSNEAPLASSQPPRSQVRGPIQHFEALVSKAGASPDDLEAYARYLTVTGGDPEAEHRARDLASRAAEAAPTIDRLLLAGQLAEDRNQQRAWVERAAEIAGRGHQNLDILLAEAALARSGPNWRDAVPIYERMRRIDESSVPATLGLTELYIRAGLKHTALQTLEHAVVRQPHSVSLLRVYAAQLRAVGRDTEASEVESRYASLRFDDAGYLHEHVELALARRDRAGAERWLARLLRSEPDATWAQGVAARTYRALGQTPRAFAAYELALAMAPEDVPTLRALSDLHGVTGNSDEQLRLLRKILELYPQAKDVREYVEHIEPSEPRADEAYAWAPERFLQMRDLPSERYPKRTLRDLTVATVYENGIATRFNQIVFQPLTDEAAASAREYAFAYQGDRQAVELRAARVYRKDGKIDEAIESGEGAANNPAIAMYTSVRTFYVRFPRLEVGDIVELRYRVDDVVPQEDMADYFGEVEGMQSDEPIASVEYVLVTPKDRTFYAAVSRLDDVQHESKVDGEQRVQRWWATNVAPVAPEPAMPPWGEILGQIHVSTFASWDDVGAWYWALSREQFDVDDEVRKITEELTRGMTTEAEKVRAVYGYATELRYVALEFGIEGIRPRRCALTLARGWGDCKDKATIIVTMLRELGIDSTIVLVRTGMRGNTETSPASLAPFDHAIAYVPSLDLYLDGTAEGHGSRELPAMDRGSLALQVNEGKPKLVRIPHPKAAESPSNRKVDVTLAADGSAQLKLDFDVVGVNAPALRARYHGEGTRKDRASQDLAPEFGPVEVTSVAVGDLDDIEKHVELGFRGKARTFARREGDQMSIPLARPQRMVARYASLSVREHPVVLGPLVSHEDTWSVRLPPGKKAVSIPTSSSAKTPFGSYSYEVQTAGGRVTVKSKITIDKPRVEPQEYAAFRRFCEAVDRTFEQRLVFGQ